MHHQANSIDRHKGGGSGQHYKFGTHNLALRVAGQMPPLDHFHKGRPFNILESDVIAWLVKQPEVVQSLFNFVRASGAIVLDLETKQWRGADYRGH